MKTTLAAVSCLLLFACGVDSTLAVDDPSWPGEEDELGTTQQEITCAPVMSRFPVNAPHNIGYDPASCGTGTCRTSCPDQNKNSDWGGSHHGIDVFAFQRAPLVAVADGTITAVGVPSSTSGLRVRLRDRCGWEYYYGHMDQAVVSVGQRVSAGQQLGFMGRTGAASTHLHFNVSPDGRYSSDINPFNLLSGTSGTACAAPPPPPAPPPAPSGCGIVRPGVTLSANQSVASCDGRHVLVMQGDGNLVLYNQGRWIWQTATNGRGGQRAVMQTDGNFVLYTAGNTPLFNTRTNGVANAYLAVQDDGNLVVYQGSSPRWASNTAGR
ncbi:MAG: peptidoglycan DD-metalloendopeptidase family protein [Archangium sp.]